MTDSALDRARLSANEALGWLAAGLTVLIDSRNLDNLPEQEIVISFLRQGEEAIARIEAAARLAGVEEGMEKASLLAETLGCESHFVTIVGQKKQVPGCGRRWGMTADDLRAALARADAACPCAKGEAQVWCHSHSGWTGLSICKCNPALRHENQPLNQNCLWEGHAAVREAMRAAAEWGNDNGILTQANMDEELSAILGEPKGGVDASFQ